MSRQQRKQSYRDRLKERRQRREINSNAALSEFSDSDSPFYVDEIEERRVRERQQKRTKKVEKKRERERRPMTPTARKIIRITSFVGILLVILVVGIVLSLTVLFKTESYLVEGNTHYDEQEIIDTCGIRQGENIFLAPKASAAKKIKEKYAYVEEVDVGFQIPDTISIKIEEAQGGYLVEYSDKYLLVSTKGRILEEVTDTGSNDLPIFIGPNPKSGKIGDYIEYESSAVTTITDSITGVFSDNGYQGITEINAKDTGNISFTYDNRIKVKLGLPEDLSYKIRTAMTIINEKIDINDAAQIEGQLDVSRCNVTKRSYFDEKPLLSLESPTTATQSPTDENGNPVETNEGLSSDTEGESATEPAEQNNSEEETKPLTQDQWYLD